MRANLARVRHFPALLLALAVGLLPAGAVTARADHLDRELYVATETVLKKDLQKHNYRNVGVLKFRVQKGDGQPSFAWGTFNQSLATRLEVALILSNDTKDPIGIIRDAGRVAVAADRKSTYLTADGRASLFKLRYPLAWGDKKVEADAFLTGLVKVSADLKESTVIVQAFDRESKDLREVTKLTVKNDRSILSDLGKSFAVSKRSLTKRETKEEDLDEEAVTSAYDRDKGGETPRPPTPDEDLVGLKMLVDGKEYEPVPDLQSPGELGLPEPQGDPKVSFHLTNKTTERLAVVFRVNGVNTIEDEQGKQIDQYTKWILEPKKTYRIRGYYAAGMVGPFKILSDAEAEQSPLADLSSRGYLQLDVFREAANPNLIAEPRKRGLNTRGPSRREWQSSAPATAAEAKALIRKSTGLAVNKKGIIGKGDGEPGEVKEGAFEAPVHAYEMKIRYLAKN